jgi:Integrase zinc binding domain/Integrase core domain
MAVTELIPQWMEELKDSYSGDTWASVILARSQDGQVLPTKIIVHGGIIRKGSRIYVGCNNHWRGKLVQSLHDSSIGGHSDILGTYQIVKNLLY